MDSLAKSNEQPTFESQSQTQTQSLSGILMEGANKAVSDVQNIGDTKKEHTSIQNNQQ